MVELGDLFVFLLEPICKGDLLCPELLVFLLMPRRHIFHLFIYLLQLPLLFLDCSRLFAKPDLFRLNLFAQISLKWCLFNNFLRTLIFNRIMILNT